jgi:pyruvate dehydrogenase phosphatase regulatory subunit
VQEVVAENGAVHGVKTNQGFIECDNFVNTASTWARFVGTLSYPRVQIPLHPVEHYFLHTRSIPALTPNTPVVRDPDGHVYFRENDGRFLAGGFEPEAKPVSSPSSDLSVDWDHFHILLEALLHRVPSMGDAYLEELINAPEPFSPDGQWILGKAPEVNNFFVSNLQR